MKERPILFSGSMVRAILDGRKTQTRRVVKLEGVDDPEWYENRDGDICPYGQPSDLLWVRETWALGAGTFTPIKGATSKMRNGALQPVLYRANEYANDEDFVWRPSIHMPRWASRLTLRITDVRVQRVQEITEKDARTEGIHDFPPDRSAVGIFCELWDSINAKRGYSWDSNPWVWALSFEVVK